MRKLEKEMMAAVNEADFSEYSFGMMAKLTSRNDFELDEKTISKLDNINGESIDTETSYVSVMVRSIKTSCDEYGYCSLTIECAISAPDMPTHEIEQETGEILWYWLENITGKRLTLGFDWESEDVVFDRRSNNI